MLFIQKQVQKNIGQFQFGNSLYINLAFTTIFAHYGCNKRLIYKMDATGA